MNYSVEYLYAEWSTQYQQRLTGSGIAGIKVIAPPVQEQLTMAEVAEHLRLHSDGGSPPVYPDQDWVEPMISAAREICEERSGLAFAPQTLEISLGEFPATTTVAWDQGVPLLVGPILGVLSVSYTTDGVVTTLVEGDDYTVDLYSAPAMLFPAASWPSITWQSNAVKIRVRAGYDLAGDSPLTNPLPKRYRAAMLLVLGHLYENRENSSATTITEIPMGVSALLEGRDRLRLSMA